MMVIHPGYRSALHVEEFLQSHVQAVEQIAASEWQVLLHDCPGLLVTVRTVESLWLTFTAAVPSRGVGSLSDAELWALLEWNNDLPGGVRFAVRSGVHCVSLQAEIVIDTELNLTARIADTCAGLRRAWALIHAGKDEQAEAHPLSRCATPVPEHAYDLVSLCRETQWPWTERTDGRITIELDVPHASFVATLTQPQGDGVRIAVDLLATDTLTNPCRGAVGVLLLTVSGVVRLMRMVAIPRAEHAAVQGEVTFTHTPTVNELTHAFSALSVAVRLCHRELAVLQHDELIATEYRALWRMPQAHKRSC